MPYQEENQDSVQEVYYIHAICACNMSLFVKISINEPRREKTGVSHMRKQRRRSALR